MSPRRLTWFWLGLGGIVLLCVALYYAYRVQVL